MRGGLVPSNQYPAGTAFHPSRFQSDVGGFRKAPKIGKGDLWRKGESDIFGPDLLGRIYEGFRGFSALPSRRRKAKDGSRRRRKNGFVVAVRKRKRCLEMTADKGLKIRRKLPSNRGRATSSPTKPQLGVYEISTTLTATVRRYRGWNPGCSLSHRQERIRLPGRSELAAVDPIDYGCPLSITVAYFIKKSLQMTGLIRNGYLSPILGRKLRILCRFDSRLIVHFKSDRGQIQPHGLYD